VSFASWTKSSLTHRLLLLHKGVTLGVPVSWKNTASLVPPQPQSMVIANGEFEIHSVDYDINEYIGPLADNCTGTVPLDHFLVTIPLYCHPDSCPDSFVSLFDEGHAYCFGIVQQRKLVVAFRMSPPDPSRLPAYLGRIERYWYMKKSREDFPGQLIIIGSPEHVPEGIFTQKPRVISLGHAFDMNGSAVKALGVALTKINSELPVLSPATPESAFRHARSGLLLGGCAILFLALASIASVAVFSSQVNARYQKAMKLAVRVIAEDAKLQQRITHCRLLAKSVEAYSRLQQSHSGWAPLLKAIADTKPDSIVIDRIGSQPSDGSGQASFAIAGQAINRKQIVTTQVPLSSIC
jgi:hypothetical protein